MPAHCWQRKSGGIKEETTMAICRAMPKVVSPNMLSPESMLSQQHMLGRAPSAGKKKTGQERTTPVGFDLTRSLVIRRATQDCRHMTML